MFIVVYAIPYHKAMESYFWGDLLAVKFWKSP